MADNGKILVEISQSLGEVKGEVKGLRGEVVGLRRDVNKIHENVTGMPHRWQGDIKEAIKDHKKQEDEVTGVQNLVRFRNKNDSVPPKSRKHNGVWVSRRVLITIGKIVGYIVLGAGTIYGAWHLPGPWKGK